MTHSYVQPAAQPAPSEQLSFLSVLNFILKHLALLAFMGVVFSALLVLRAFRGPDTYTATALFSAGEESSQGLLSGLSLPGISSGKGPTYYVALMTSPAVLEPLVEQEFTVGPNGKKATLIDYYAGTSGRLEVRKEAAIGELSGSIDAKVAATTGWITLRVTAKSPQLAFELAQAVLTQLERFNTATRREQSLADRKFAEDRLVEIVAERQIIERRMQAFLERNRDCCSPALQFEKEHIAAELASKQAMYNSMLASYEREKLNAVRELRVVTIMGRPKVPFGPDQRPWKRAAVIGMFIGVMLASIIAFVREYFRWIRDHPSPEYSEFLKLRARMLGWAIPPFRRAKAPA